MRFFMADLYCTDKLLEKEITILKDEVTKLLKSNADIIEMLKSINSTNVELEKEKHELGK